MDIYRAPSQSQESGALTVQMKRTHTNTHTDDG